MKTLSITNLRFPGAAAMALACSLALAPTSQAKDHGMPDHRSKKSHNDDARRSYSSHPRSGFTVTLGTGYAGRGYYYGPPNSAYYYQRPDVMYYATRELVPRSYYGQSRYSGNSVGVDVQRALARRGYYRGSIDGQIGPQSSRAIARYQQDHGLRMTGNISQGLLNSLRLQ
jgi:hypothetical protein